MIFYFYYIYKNIKLIKVNYLLIKLVNNFIINISIFILKFFTF